MFCELQIHTRYSLYSNFAYILSILIFVYFINKYFKFLNLSRFLLNALEWQFPSRDQ